MDKVESMPGIRKRGEEIRDFILTHITECENIAAVTSQHYGISLQAVYKHIDRLVSSGQLAKKAGRYVLRSKQYKYMYRNNQELLEDAVWEQDIKKHFAGVPHNIYQIWTYGFLEMFNNAIEHSRGEKIRVMISENRMCTALSVSDDGVGIFKNIKMKFRLFDEKDALLELAKGKRTTDKTRHSGQGIFFTSKVFDDFTITSNGITYNADPEKIMQTVKGKQKYATVVYMNLVNTSNKLLKNVFDTYSSEIPGDFDKTVVPVSLAHSNDLVSRSQARRILSGLELFRNVTLDFKGIDYIGQAFADEIFRVFATMNPHTVIIAQNANVDVQSMINRAVHTKI